MSKRFCWVVTHTADDEKTYKVGQGVFNRDIPTPRAALEFAAALPASFRVFNEQGFTLLQGKCDAPVYEEQLIGKKLPLMIGGELAKGIEIDTKHDRQVYAYAAFGQDGSAL